MVCHLYVRCYIVQHSFFLGCLNLEEGTTFIRNSRTIHRTKRHIPEDPDSPHTTQPTAPPIRQHTHTHTHTHKSQTVGELVKKGFKFGHTFWLMVVYSNGNQLMALGLSGSRR